MRQHNINQQALKQINSDIKLYSPQPSLVQVIAVTKKFNYTAINSAYQSKITCIGENKVQEFLSKKKEIKELENKIETHLIGHLQTNKVNKAVGFFDVIQTVDSLKIAEKINKKAEEKNIKQKVYIQINIGKDPKKYGFDTEDLYKKIEEITEKKQLKLKGLMTILPFENDVKFAQPLFAKMKKIQHKVISSINPDCEFLSMGMSRDYIYALKEGATHLRIGTKLYGQRP